YKGLFAGGGNFDIPATATIGLAFKTTPTSTLAFDVQKIFYSDIDSIANPLLPNIQTAQLGTSNGAGFGWEDMTVYKLGYQWSTSPAWTWRAGYSYGKQPIPSSEVLLNILAPAVMEQHFTFGFTNKLSPTSEWNFAAMYAPEKKVSGANPLSPGQTIELKMYQYQVEASYSWKF
ncbi:MAG TPA: outer membrane protein transport protein, partial [Gammaproteobacteria bacterium]|nr:outer membrane protein transport protein [Gammaproteobacteria bacterium]